MFDLDLISILSGSAKVILPHTINTCTLEPEYRNRSGRWYPAFDDSCSGERRDPQRWRTRLFRATEVAQGDEASCNRPSEHPASPRLYASALPAWLRSCWALSPR